jgi:hypothetical protein
MFDLDWEVDAWTAKAFGTCRSRAATRAELKDHLLCAIERLEEAGLPREEAFRRATAALEGTADSLSGAEHALRRGRLAHSILWAALILATALLFARSDDRDGFTTLLLLVLVPIWFAADRLVLRLLGAPAGR